MEIIFDCVRGEVQKCGCAVMSRSCLGFIVVAAVLVLLVLLPDRDQQDHQEGENHLHVGQRIHAKGAEDDQLDHLQRGKVVDFPLRHAANVVGGRVGGLGRKNFLFRGFSQSVTQIPQSKSNHLPKIHFKSGFIKLFQLEALK